MTGAMTDWEMTRAIERLETAQEHFVSKELHTAIVAGLREDIAELKATVNKMVWAVVALFAGIATQIIVAIATRGLP